MLSEQVRINLLGPFEISRVPKAAALEPPLEITATKLRQVLAMLAVNAGTTVSTEQLIDELWPFGPPRTVKTIVQTYIYQLRRFFCRGFRSLESTDLLITRPDGYRLTVPRDNIDVFQFQHLMEFSRSALRQGKASCSAEVLRKSLDLWRGPMSADVVSGPTLYGLSVYLEEQRLEAVSLRIEADLANNRHREIVGELRSLVATHRLHELFHMRLMQALHRSGRRDDALNVYHQLRQILDEELGLEPSPEAQELQYEILQIGGISGPTPHRAIGTKLFD
jgi:SARP family transcriptional regulator, regulator of embCAB operon